MQTGVGHDGVFGGRRAAQIYPKVRDTIAMADRAGGLASLDVRGSVCSTAVEKCRLVDQLVGLPSGPAEDR